MPKQKRHKGLAKRVKITANGKVKRRRCNGGHLMSSMSSKRKRNLGKSTLVKGAKAANVKRALCA